MTANHNQPEFTRRKFTLPPTTDNILTNLAERHYQGNVSLFLRAAIEDHRDTLEGTGSGERSIHEVGQAISQINESHGDLDDKLTKILEIIDQQQTLTPTQIGPEIGAFPEPVEQIHQHVLNATQGCRFDDLVEQTQLPKATIQSALHTLLDVGLVSQPRDGRFYPVGRAPQGVNDQ